MESKLSRLHRVIQCDRLNIANGLPELLRKDISSLLSNYFELGTEQLEVSVTLRKSGGFDISVNAFAEKVKSLKIVN